MDELSAERKICIHNFGLPFSTILLLLIVVGRDAAPRHAAMAIHTGGLINILHLSTFIIEVEVDDWIGCRRMDAIWIVALAELGLLQPDREVGPASSGSMSLGSMDVMRKSW